MDILIGKDGKQIGPFTEDQVRSMFENGMLLPTDLAWYEGQTSWYPLWQLYGVPPPLSHVQPSTNTQHPAGMGDEPWGRIGAAWGAFILSLMPGKVGLLGLFPLTISLIILFSSKNAKARWHGNVILCVAAGILVFAFLFGLASGGAGL